jgi:preprotein translocase subunit SecD
VALTFDIPHYESEKSAGCWAECCKPSAYDGRMKRNLRTRSIVIGIVILVSLVIMFGPWNKDEEYKRTSSDFFSPTRLKQNLSENIRLGLDLKGGTHLVLQVQTNDALAAISDGNKAKALEILKKENLKYTDVKHSVGEVVVETPDGSQHAAITDKLLADFGSFDWDATTRTDPSAVIFRLKTSSADAIRKGTTEQAKMIIEQRIDAFGVAEPTVQLYGREEDHQILVQMPGVDDPERVKKLLRTAATLEIKAVVPPGNPFPSKEAALSSLGSTLPEDREILPSTERNGGGESYYVVEKAPVVTGVDLRNAQAAPAEQGLAYKVRFALKPNGAEKFGNWTEKNIGNYLAVVLKDDVRSEIKSAAVVRDKITDSGEITGTFTQQQAEDLALVLRSGALPAGIVYLEERTVGPSLGADSIRQGMIASIAGLLFVGLFMLFYYRFSGLNAVIALILNLVLLLAGLALFNATLTLPGIAGVILTIGMAVDSNVLIFERIREELRAGKIVASAVDTGFGKALVTIIDTHVTTVVSAIFLYFFGTGPIRGFAVALVIGLLANLFTAIYVSRTMFTWALNRGGQRAETLSI